MTRMTWKQILTPAAYIFLLGLIAIFAHSGLQSSYGLAALRAADDEERRLSQELDQLTRQRAEMENKVRRLSDQYLDVDLLDERARDVLGLTRQDELVIR